MEIKGLIFIVIALFGGFLIMLLLGDLALQNADWTTISQQSSIFIIAIAVLAVILYVIKENS